MGVHLGAGWHLTHLTDRVVCLRKDDPVYRKVTGRPGYVRIRAEPGMDRNELLSKAVTMAKRNDELLSGFVVKDILPKTVGRYQNLEGRLHWAFRTPQDADVIGVKAP